MLITASLFPINYCATAPANVEGIPAQARIKDSENDLIPIKKR